MLLWGALVALLDPAPGHLMIGLAVVVAALLVAAAVALPAPAARSASGLRPSTRHTRTAGLIRLLDPDSAGRPRPRAPSGSPANA
jgi:hypothetical protein